MQPKTHIPPISNDNPTASRFMRSPSVAPPRMGCAGRCGREIAATRPPGKAELTGRSCTTEAQRTQRRQIPREKEREDENRDWFDWYSCISLLSLLVFVFSVSSVPLWC